MPLFDSTDLSDYLHREVSAPAAAVAERVASGWLAGAGVDVTVVPVPAQVFSWALELGAIAFENPAGLSAQTTGDERDEWAIGRRKEILEAASGQPGSSGRGRPQGSFPAAAGWPDPADRYGYGCVR